MIHFNGVDESFKQAFQIVLEYKDDNKDKIEDILEDTHGSLGDVLLSIGVESVHMEKILLKRSIETFNSVPSCDSKDLQEVRQLLALLPAHSVSPSVACAVGRERAIMELVDLLSTLQVDLLPLQLRLLSSAEIARRLLEQRPQAYYEIDGKEIFDELYSDGEGSDVGEGGQDRQDLLLRRAMLRDKAPPGERLIRVLGAFQFSSSSSLLACSSTLHKSLQSSKSEIQLQLLFAAITLGDLEGAYRLSRALLPTAVTAKVEQNTNIPLKILEATLLVIGMLECAEATSRTKDLYSALRSDLLVSVLSNTSPVQLEKCNILWRSSHTPSSTSSSYLFPSGEPSPSQEPSSTSSSYLFPSGEPSPSQEPSSAPSSLSIINNDKDYIYDARQIILTMIANSLKTNESVSTTSSEMIAKAGVVTNYTSDSMGYLLLVQEVQLVHTLLETLHNDLDKKLSAALLIENEGYYDQRHSSNSALDEGKGGMGMMNLIHFMSIYT
jgi:hypothetical protein